MSAECKAERSEYILFRSSLNTVHFLSAHHFTLTPSSYGRLDVIYSAWYNDRVKVTLSNGARKYVERLDVPTKRRIRPLWLDLQMIRRKEILRRLKVRAYTVCVLAVTALRFL